MKNSAGSDREGFVRVSKRQGSKISIQSRLLYHVVSLFIAKSLYTLPN